jgi:threonine/homoserine/homoserine lactone efflux protein
MPENSTNPTNSSNSSNSSNPTPVEVFTSFFRAVTRPVVTIIFAAVISQVVIESIDVPQWFLALASGCILWWFGDRTVQHIKEKKEQA